MQKRAAHLRLKTRKQVEHASLEDYLLTEVIVLPGMSSEELRHECALMIRRNCAISKFYDSLRDGTLTQGDFEEFTDILFETGWEPDEYLQEMQQNVGILLRTGEFYDY